MMDEPSQSEGGVGEVTGSKEDKAGWFASQLMNAITNSGIGGGGT